ncbi:MAG: hypothetical protein JWL89_200 [Candidatus Saccharibacteria bacterium]|nr:hypothetical protein [Candidatus Saccharibacteria bacterium]
MSKTILWFSFITLAFLVICVMFAPTSPAIWLASQLPGYMALRLALMSVMVALILTEPPRNRWFRLFVGGLAIGLTSWVLSATYQNQMQFLDSTSILIASISMGIVALEYTPEPAAEPKKLRAKHGH